MTVEPRLICGEGGRDECDTDTGHGDSDARLRPRAGPGGILHPSREWLHVTGSMLVGRETSWLG